MKCLNKIKVHWLKAVFLFIMCTHGSAFSQSRVANSKKIHPLIYCEALDSLHSNNPDAVIKISYGQKIHYNCFENSMDWSVTSGSEQFNVKGVKISDYVFEKPGFYKITFLDLAEDKIIDDEGVANFIEVDVAPYKMTFDWENAIFSNEIRKGIDTIGILLSVPIRIDSYNGKIDKKIIKEYSTEKVHTAGVGTNIEGQSKEDTNLKIGLQILRYKLKGIASEEAYIMFDFTDINGRIQSFSYSKLIK